MRDFVPIDDLFEFEAEQYLLPKERADARRARALPSRRSEVPEGRPRDLVEAQRLDKRRQRAGLARRRESKAEIAASGRSKP